MMKNPNKLSSYQLYNRMIQRASLINQFFRESDRNGEDHGSFLSSINTIINLFDKKAMLNISNRRKMKSSLMMGMEDDNNSFLRSNTYSKTFTNMAPPSSHDMKKMIKELEEEVKEEREKRLEAEENLDIYRKRTMMRQKEFYTVLQKTHKEVQKYTQPTQDPNLPNHLTEAYGKIFRQFEQSNEATNQFLENRFKDNLSMMERRIHQIMETVSEQTGKAKKISDASYKSVKKQIESIMGLAIGIEEENKRLKKNLDDQIFKNKLLKEEKTLLIEELVQKKKVISKMHDEMKKETTDLNQSRKNSITSDIVKANKTSSRAAHPSTKAETKEKSFKFFCEPSIQVNDFNPNRSLNLNQKLIRPTTSKPSRNEAKKSYGRSLGQSKFTSFIDKPLAKSNIQDISSEKTIQHLKICLERERKRVYDLGKIVTQIQNKNNEINEALVTAMQEQKNIGDSKSIENLMKSEKLFQAIRDLKKRLGMCEKPSINCGWGQLDLNQVLQQAKN